MIITINDNNKVTIITMIIIEITINNNNYFSSLF